MPDKPVLFACFLNPELQIWKFLKYKCCLCTVHTAIPANSFHFPSTIISLDFLQVWQLKKAKTKVRNKVNKSILVTDWWGELFKYPSSTWCVPSKVGKNLKWDHGSNSKDWLRQCPADPAWHSGVGVGVVRLFILYRDLLKGFGLNAVVWVLWPAKCIVGYNLNKLTHIAKHRWKPIEEFRQRQSSASWRWQKE